ncbi:sugar phosphate isomerase/epimerase family protein, partial [Sphingomonas sp.]|uniref:sugar phosphate isomerase/epimerase family protein n=1 Tax=Sphingomonas sp. TaxID=28214 RepID=UPI0035B00402
MYLPFRFGVSAFTTMPWSFERDVAHYAQAGVDAIEVVEAKLDDDRLAEQMDAITAAGLTISGVQPRVRTFFASRMMPDPPALEDRVAALRGTIERLAKFAPGVPFITNTGAHPKGDMAEAMRVVARELGELGRIAADHGVLMALEPLNPSSVNVESAIWTIDQALDVIHDSGSGAVGLCLDYWNIWQQDDVEGAIARAGDRIFTVQASDWRTPRSFADRIVPGDGEIPLDRLLAATHATGYDRPYAIEIFSNDVADSLYDGDLDAVITRSR